jgi:hypothetical protein
MNIQERVAHVLCEDKQICCVKDICFPACTHLQLRMLPKTREVLAELAKWLRERAKACHSDYAEIELIAAADEIDPLAKETVHVL